MYTLHAFASRDEFIDNGTLKISPIGELSTEAETYALDKGIHTLPNIPSTTLFSFKSVRDNTDTDVPVPVLQNSIELSQWIFNKCLDLTFIGNVNVVNQAIQAEFKTRLDRIKIGRMVSDGKNRYIPEFIEFSIKGFSEDNRIKIWFADASFRQQYPYHDIIVIPVIDNLDDFFGDVDAVLGIQVDQLLPKIHDKANHLKGKSPYTKILTFNYDWYNPSNTEQRKVFPWTVLIYGGINSNLDLIKDAIVKHVLANSTHDRNRWEKIFPDLFVPSEYIIAPHWTAYSVPNKSIVAGMFSPTVKYAEVSDFIRPLFGNYTQEHLNANLEITSSLYKSLALFICGHPQNRLAPISFYQKWPEYALMRSVSDDFNRFSVNTQLFVKSLTELLKWADESTPDTELPEHMTRMKRGDIYYVAITIDRVQYIAVMRWNYTHGTLATPQQ